MKIVHVKWRDAVFNPGWIAEHLVDGWDELSDPIIDSVGVLVKETENYLILSMGIRHEDVDTDKQFIGVHKIPKAWVISSKEINISR